MEPLVSIIIPAYNAEQWIRESVESALNQTWKKKEILVVDDGSADRTLEIVKGYSSRGVKAISEENAGASAARNRGLALAQGDYIQYLDADDIIAADKLEIQIATLKRAGRHAVGTASWTTSRKEFEQRVSHPETLWSVEDPIEWVSCLLEGKGMMLPHAWLTPRLVIERAGPWDEALSLNDDREYFTRIVLNSSGIRYSEAAICFYRRGEGSTMSSRRDKQAWLSAKKVSEACRRYLLERDNGLRARKACALDVVNLAVTFGIAFPEAISYARREIGAMGVRQYWAPCGGAFGYVSRVVGWERALWLKRAIQRERRG